MNNFRCEFALRVPVAKWLLSRGLSPICEVQSLNNCDLVGIRIASKPRRLTELVAVELKLKDVAGVLRQCESHKRPLTEVWAAMPLSIARRHAERFDVAGIGLLGVGDSVHRLVDAERVEGCDLSRWKSLIRRRNEHLWRMQHPLMLRAQALQIMRDAQVEVA